MNRVFGIETEFGCFVRSPSLGPPERVVELVKEGVFKDSKWGLLDWHVRDPFFEPARSGGFLINGGRLYIDAVGSHEEYATPECRSIFDIVAYDKAGQRIICQVLKELGFQGREHRGPADAVNAMLNYGYGILYGHVWGAVMNAGLEPFAGFLHTDRSGKPSLVLDLTEEFRQPVVDRAVLAWLNRGGKGVLSNGLLDAESREAVAGRVMARLQASESYRGKTYQIRSIIQMQARLAAAAVRGIKPYRPFTFRW